MQEVRLIDADGKNVGVVKTRDAIERAKKVNLDLVEVTANARPPVVQITNYGKFQYTQNKLKKKYASTDKERGKKKRDEVKQIQIKPGTSGGMLVHRATMIRKWLNEESKVQIDLFLFGRYKGMDKIFLQGRLIAFLKTIEGEFYLSDTIKKSPKGFSVTLQATKGKSTHSIDKDSDNKEIMAPEIKEQNEL